MKTLPYRDDPSVHETFSDSFRTVIFDGALLRLEFTIQRFDNPSPPKPPSGYAKTAARLVMPAQAFVEMYNQLGKVMAVLAQQGLVTMDGKPAAAASKDPKTVQ